MAAKKSTSLKLRRSGKKKKVYKKPVKIAQQAKIKKVMEEFKAGTLHSGSKLGPEVTNPKQAIAIGYSEARKAKKKRSK